MLGMPLNVRQLSVAQRRRFLPLVAPGTHFGSVCCLVWSVCMAACLQAALVLEWNSRVDCPVGEPVSWCKRWDGARDSCSVDRPLSDGCGRSGSECSLPDVGR